VDRKNQSIINHEVFFLIQLLARYLPLWRDGTKIDQAGSALHAARLCLPYLTA
jgi:hypothetical protein